MLALQNVQHLQGESHLQIVQRAQQVLEIAIDVIMGLVKRQSMRKGVQKVIVCLVGPVSSFMKVLSHHFDHLRYLGFDLKHIETLT